MAMWMGRCLGTTPWDSSEMEMAPMTAEVRKTITSLILAQMEQVSSQSTCTQRVDVDGVVA